MSAGAQTGMQESRVQLRVAAAVQTANGCLPAFPRRVCVLSCCRRHRFRHSNVPGRQQKLACSLGGCGSDSSSDSAAACWQQKREQRPLGPPCSICVERPQPQPCVLACFLPACRSAWERATSSARWPTCRQSTPQAGVCFRGLIALLPAAGPAACCWSCCFTCRQSPPPVCSAQRPAASRCKSLPPAAAPC